VNLELTSGLLLLGTAVPIAGGLVWYAWHNRSLPGARPFALVVILAACWAMCYIVELLANSLDAKLFWANLQYLSICFMPVAWLVMALDYAGRLTWLNLRRNMALCAMPVFTLALLWTDGYHHLMRATVWLDASGPFPVVGRTWGAWFWIHSVYGYALVISAVVVLTTAAFSAPAIYRRQAIALVAGSVFATGWHLAFGIVPGIMSSLDFTPLAIVVAGIAVAGGLFRVRFFNLVPVARHALVENMTDGVLVVDQYDRVVDLNKSAQTLIGQPLSRILGRPLADCWEAWEQMTPSSAAGASRAELQIGDNGDRRHYEVEWSPLKRNDQTVGRLVALRDVTDRVLMEDNLRRQALTDDLTGLPNRALFMARLDDAIHQARRHGDALFAVMVLDLDRFKLINDSIGHLAGDVLLRSVAIKLKRCVREADTVARMGGDEFMILLPMITGAHDLLPVLERIQEELRAPVYFRQQEMAAASSVGVVIWDPSYESPEDLLRAADTAMYQAKEAGRGCHRFFDEDMHKSVMATLNAETDLRVALRQRDFSLAYQPIVDLKTGSIHSLEALIRWRHARRGTLRPDEFLAVAENSGLIVKLGVMALEEVCGQLSGWQSPGNPAAALPVRLNLSPRQLVEPDFVSTVVNRLAYWSIPADLLVLEITETALIGNPIRSKQAMQELKSLGIRLCLDDFGTGWSSLQHLTTFPVQELKIDQAFVSKIVRGNTDAEVVRLLTALAHTLGLGVTAEGVESGEQLQVLTDFGCDCGQGYFIGVPMEPDRLLGYLEDMARGSCMLARSSEPGGDRPMPLSERHARDTTEPWYYRTPLLNSQPLSSQP
jgi:diguanylate cyclase (GGDEF)-like protein/PAS domain S-box-containing protein